MAVFGDHEFDYGTDRLQELVVQSNAQYLFANYKYTGNAGDKFADTEPFTIVSYGDVKVAYIGLSAPKSIEEDGQVVYDFFAGNKLYKTAQKYADIARVKGADYVIVICHLGIEETSDSDSSYDLVANTHGIDVIIDAHSHSEISSQHLINDRGEGVILTQTGTKLSSLGVLTIGQDGSVTTKLVQPTKKDASVDLFIKSIEDEYKEL